MKCLWVCTFPERALDECEIANSCFEPAWFWKRAKASYRQWKSIFRLARHSVLPPRHEVHVAKRFRSKQSSNSTPAVPHTYLVMFTGSYSVSLIFI
jgi:hypothetical protein